jgi:hypothetical protein
LFSSIESRRQGGFLFAGEVLRGVLRACVTAVGMPRLLA